MEFNPASEVLFGWTREEAIGRELGELFIPAAHAGAHRDGILRYVATGEGPVLNQRLELPAVRRDGTALVVELIAVPMVHDGRREFTGFIRDITELRRTQELLRESQARYEAIVRHSTKALVLCTPDGVDGTFLAGEWLLGLPSGTPLPGGFLSIVHPDDRAGRGAPAGRGRRRHPRPPRRDGPAAAPVGRQPPGLRRGRRGPHRPAGGRRAAHPRRRRDPGAAARAPAGRRDRADAHPHRQPRLGGAARGRHPPRAGGQRRARRPVPPPDQRRRPRGHRLQPVRPPDQVAVRRPGGLRRRRRPAGQPRASRSSASSSRSSTAARWSATTCPSTAPAGTPVTCGSTATSPSTSPSARCSPTRTARSPSWPR